MCIVASVRTNIVIDEELMAEASSVGTSTMRETVDLALRELVRRKQRKQTLDLFGTVDWDGDLAGTRRSRLLKHRTDVVIVVDTSVWTDWFAGRSTPQTRLLTLLVEDDASIALTDVGLTEILQGLRTERQARRVDDVLSSYEILRLEPLTDHRHAALMYRQCRRAGVTIRSTIDCLDRRGRIVSRRPSSQRRRLRPPRGTHRPPPRRHIAPGQREPAGAGARRPRWG